MTVSPNGRRSIEEAIIQALDHHGTLGTRNLRLWVKESVKKPPISDRRIALICRSLCAKGIIRRSGEARRRALWALKRY